MVCDRCGAIRNHALESRIFIITMAIGIISLEDKQRKHSPVASSLTFTHMGLWCPFHSEGPCNFVLLCFLQGTRATSRLVLSHPQQPGNWLCRQTRKAGADCRLNKRSSRLWVPIPELAMAAAQGAGFRAPEGAQTSR